MATMTERKSVSFSNEAVMVDVNGKVTEVNGNSDKTSAESHAAGLSFTHRTGSDGGLLSKGNGGSEAPKDAAVDEVTDLFKGLGKKKKSSKKTKDDAGEGGEDAAPAADGEFDPSALKKKKKKKTTKAADSDDFEAKLAEAGVSEGADGDGDGAKAADEDDVSGDMDTGTGIWTHDANKPIKYELLLERFFSHLHRAHPDLMLSGSKSYVIPPPQCLREGNKKTIFANIPDICKRMKRSDEHVMQFIFAELGTSGSVDGNRRLVIKGRFQQKQIENVLRRYIGKPEQS